MPASGGARRVVHLGWRANGDGFDVALAVHRLLAAGGRAWWLTRKHGAAAAGDYLVEVTQRVHDALLRFGLRLEPWPAAIPEDARALASPRVRLFAGHASKYPYFAYYALCLLRLGIDYVACDGASLARSSLDRANLLVLPGGFATWGIDAAEGATGADASVCDFLARGGAALGSCGGAFYLSAGRPGWTGTADAMPLYTHEYLQSGVAIVSIALAASPLGLGLPPTIEVPYYHGPIYDLVGPQVDVAATFHAFTLPGRLAIDNPLDRERFDREMKGKPAILVVNGERGRAVLFSPHPEMGDLVRKYVALDGYVRRYLPIRGLETLRDTMRHYRVTDSPSFRLVQNATHLLALPEAAQATGEDARDAVPARTPPDSFPLNVCRRALAALPDFGSGDEGALLRDVATGIGRRFAIAAERFASVRDDGTPSALLASWQHFAQALAEHRLAADAAASQRLMDVDLAVSLIECWTRLAELDRSLASP